jgi:hypothetical protein
LYLPGRHLNAWATPPDLFALVIFQIGSHVYAWDSLGHVLLFTLPG